MQNSFMKINNLYALRIVKDGIITYKPTEYLRGRGSIGLSIEDLRDYNELFTKKFTIEVNPTTGGVEEIELIK